MSDHESDRVYDDDDDDDGAPLPPPPDTVDDEDASDPLPPPVDVDHAVLANDDSDSDGVNLDVIPVLRGIVDVAVEPVAPAAPVAAATSTSRRSGSSQVVRRHAVGSNGSLRSRRGQIRVGDDNDDDDDDDDDDARVPDDGAVNAPTEPVVAAPIQPATAVAAAAAAAASPLMSYQENLIGVARNETLSASLLALAHARVGELDDVDVERGIRTIEVVGKGAFGAVYKAEVVASGRVVAAKRLNFRSAQEQETIEREIAILRACTCEYIVGFFGACDVPGAKWIFMEFCPSVVSEIIEFYRETDRHFSEPEIRTVVVWLLQALAFLHELDVIHRDVKADNLLLNAAGYPKLADFGVSGQMASPLTSMVGTPAFIAPEVVGAKPGENSGYNEKVDIWAAGVTAIQCADLAEPYEGQNPFRVLFKIPTAPSPTLLNPASRSAELNEFIALCLRKDPNERPGARQLLASASFAAAAADAHEGDARAPSLLHAMNELALRKSATLAAAQAGEQSGAAATDTSARGSGVSSSGSGIGGKSGGGGGGGGGNNGDVSSSDSEVDDDAAAPADTEDSKRRRRRERRERHKERERSSEKGRSAKETKELIREKKRRMQQQLDEQQKEKEEREQKASRSSRRRGMSDADTMQRPNLAELLAPPQPAAAARPAAPTRSDGSAVRLCEVCKTARAKVRADGVPHCLSCLEQKKRELTYGRCVARRDFVGTGDEELAFERGDQIFIKESDANGWAYGYVEGLPTDAGWFPLSNVKVTRIVELKKTPEQLQQQQQSNRPAEVSKVDTKRRESLALLLAPRFAKPPSSGDVGGVAASAATAAAAAAAAATTTATATTRPARAAPAPPGGAAMVISAPTPTTPTVSAATRPAGPPPPVPAPIAAAQSALVLAGGELDLLVVALTSPLSGVKVGRESLRFKRFENCFQGAALLEWLQQRLRGANKTAVKERAAAQAGDLCRRRVIIDVAADEGAGDDAGEFRGKGLYRFSFGDSSLPLNGVRVYDDADVAWARRVAQDPSGWEKVLGALTADLKCAPNSITVANYVDAGSGLALVDDPVQCSHALLEELCALVQTTHVGQAIIQRDAFRAWVVRSGQLQCVQLDKASDAMRLRFFVNVFNALVLHVYLVPDAPRDEAAHSRMLQQVRVALDGALYTPADIWHGVLRGDASQLRFAADAKKRLRVIAPHARDPLVSLALCRGRAVDSPPLISLGGGGDARTSLMMVAQSLAYDTIKIDASKYEVLLPAFLEPCMRDFGDTSADQLKFLARLFVDRKATAYVVMHARSLELRFAPAASFASPISLFAAWQPQDRDMWIKK
jgi:serine/threonine protein kinase